MHILYHNCYLFSSPKTWWDDDCRYKVVVGEGGRDKRNKISSSMHLYCVPCHWPVIKLGTTLSTSNCKGYFIVSILIHPFIISSKPKNIKTTWIFRNSKTACETLTTSWRNFPPTTHPGPRGVVGPIFYELWLLTFTNPKVQNCERQKRYVLMYKKYNKLGHLYIHT